MNISIMIRIVIALTKKVTGTDIIMIIALQPKTLNPQS